ncbi:MAG TPA: type II CAAX endopeptidase family protein [Pyrinomonadaceae bacterium]
MTLEYILFNRAGRLRSGWRLLIYGLLTYLGIQMAFVLVGILLALSLGPDAHLVLNGRWGFVIQGLTILVPATLIGWACCKLLEDLPPRALGWAFHKGWLRDLLLGSLVGALSLLLAAGIAALFGGLKFTLNTPLMFQSVGETLLASIPVLILAAAWEEVIFRGYPLQTMARSHLAWVAIIITAIIFSAGHLNNPNVAKGFTFVNTALAGVWLAIAYLRTRNLWFPLGIHWAWNWTMGAVLGIPVSGIRRLTPNALLHATDFGPAWLTGGDYGLEGGAACTIALLISTIFVWRTPLFRADEEMLRLTDRENPRPEAGSQKPEFRIENR